MYNKAIVNNEKQNTQKNKVEIVELGTATTLTLGSRDIGWEKNMRSALARSISY